jgi:phage baseplate assembly protein W
MLTHPSTGDLIFLKDEEAVKRAVKNIVLTNIYERHYDSSFGTGVLDSLFEDISILTTVILQDNILAALNTYEPRIEVIAVEVTPFEEEYGYQIVIQFRIKNSLKPLTVDLFVERVR